MSDKYSVKFIIIIIIYNNYELLLIKITFYSCKV